MRFHIITIFPDMFDSYLTQSILGQAMNAGLIEVTAYDLRSYSEDKHRRVDGRVYGGGPGMVMWVDPIIKCYEDVMKGIKKNIKKDILNNNKILIVIFTPEKNEFNNAIAEQVSSEYTDIIFICGRYEGIDARVKFILEDIVKNKEVFAFKNKNKEIVEVEIESEVVEWSVGPYVLTGGELPAMICIDAISRRLPGVLNNEESLEENRVSSHEIYGRPEVYTHTSLTPTLSKGEGATQKSKKKSIKEIKEYSVPEVLLSGHHKNIEEWKIESKKI